MLRKIKPFLGRMKHPECRSITENQTIRFRSLLRTGLPVRLSNKVIQNCNLRIIGLLDEPMCMKLLCNLVNHLRTKCVLYKIVLSKGHNCFTADAQERSVNLKGIF